MQLTFIQVRRLFKHVDIECQLWFYCVMYVMLFVPMSLFSVSLRVKTQ